VHKLTTTSKEEKVKANLRELCDLHGAFYTHVPSNQFGRAGAPDYIILNKYGHTFYVECKRPYKWEQSSVQKVYQKEIEKRGAVYMLYTGLNDAELVEHLNMGEEEHMVSEYMQGDLVQYTDEGWKVLKELK